MVFLDGTPGWAVVTVEVSRAGDKGKRELPVSSRPTSAPRASPTAPSTWSIRAEVMAEDEMHQFLRTLTDPRRRAPIAVVTPDLGGDAAARAEQLAEATADAGVVVRLADRRTEELFNRLVGRELGVYGGAIRTYAAPSTPPRTATPTATRRCARPNSARRAPWPRSLTAW